MKMHFEGSVNTVPLLCISAGDMVSGVTCSEAMFCERNVRSQTRAALLLHMGGHRIAVETPDKYCGDGLRI